MSYQHFEAEKDNLMVNAIAEAFEAARRNLDPSEHDRLWKAYRAVAEGRITPSDASGGPAYVESDGDVVYSVYGKSCTCPDFEHNKPPEGRCKHRLAVKIDRRAREVFTRKCEALFAEPAPEAEPAAAPERYPEARISISLKGRLAGHPGTLVTLRGDSMSEIAQRADAVRGWAACLEDLFDNEAAKADDDNPPIW